MQTTPGPTTFGIEFLRMACWKCEAPMFGVTGLVLPPASARLWSQADWESDAWSYYHFWELEILPDATARALSERVDELRTQAPRVGPVAKRYSKTVDAVYWATICPHCDRLQGAFPMLERRVAVMSRGAGGDGVRSSRVLVYRPWPAALTEDLLYAAAGSAEVHPHVDPSWAEAMERSAIWERYYADHSE